MFVGEVNTFYMVSLTKLSTNYQLIFFMLKLSVFSLLFHLSPSDTLVLFVCFHQLFPVSNLRCAVPRVKIDACQKW